MIHADNVQKCAAVAARYIVFLLLIRGSKQLFTIFYKWIQKRRSPEWYNLCIRNKPYFTTFSLATSVLMFAQSKGQNTLTEEFVCLYIASLLLSYIDTIQNDCITYGVGMACSIMEGYLEHVLPNDGADGLGLEENIRIYEGRHGVVFPVKKLFLVATKSLYCPPDLKEFNKNDPDQSYVEASDSLCKLVKDVAGVKQRVYRNSVYKVHPRGAAGGAGGRRPVYVAAECSTPLHTLHRVLQKKAVYDDLLKSIDPSQVCEDFCSALETIIARSPACRGRCELVYYDDTDPTQNLADVLLEAIKRIEPNYEKICNK